MLYRASKQATACGLAAIALIALGACHKAPQKSLGAARAETKRHQIACASPTAYSRLKDSIFDEAIAKRPAAQANLDALADYSVVRMENPVVKGWDPSLDLTRCEGHFILEVPPGAEAALDGARQLQADLQYTAQASADGGGLVYQQRGAEPIIAKLAAFNLTAAAYRPPPAIDPDQAGGDSSRQISAREGQFPRALPGLAPKPTLPAVPAPPVQTHMPDSPQVKRQTERSSSASRPPLPPISQSAQRGEATVRAFYGALGAGNGTAASSQVIPEKRSSGPFSPGAISRFYGHLKEPLELMSVTPTGSDAYRVRYRYSTGRSHCTGGAVVRLTNRGERDLIASIRSLSGC